MFYRSKRLFFVCVSSVLLQAQAFFAATFVVTKTTDTYPTGQPGQLRWAIQQANNTAGSHQILFNIPGTGPFTIKPIDDLDPITNTVVINGYSQPGASQNSLATGDNAKIKIILNGNNYKTGDAYNGTGNGLFFYEGSDGSAVKGIAINGWINNGIVVYNANNISILGNFIGTTVTGTAQAANQTGIFIESSSTTRIGSSNIVDRNIIAGSFFYFNESACVVMNNSPNTVIKGNYIGTNASGTAKLGNSLAGITCVVSDGATIGGFTPAERNVISGHTIVGLSLESSSNVQVVGNYIGTNAAGTQSLGNLNMGIAINGGGVANSAASNNIQNNLIAGNYIGIKLGQYSSFGANQNTIQGNYIGTNSVSSKTIPNKYGIIIDDNSNFIGGSSTQTRNVISCNTVGGILLYGGAKNNIISGNYIGRDISGTNTIPNGYGIQLGLLGGKGAASTNTIQNIYFGGGNTIRNIYS